MKYRVSRKGFTLVEMLVVISIIALLTGFMVTGINAARKRAKIAKAEAEASELTKAWKSYWQVYIKWPSSFANTQVSMDAANMKILQGEDTGNNPQGLKFSNVATDGAFTDPWGTPYRVDFAQTVTADRDYYETTVGFPNRKRFEYGFW